MQGQIKPHAWAMLSRKDPGDAMISAHHHDHSLSLTLFAPLSTILEDSSTEQSGGRRTFGWRSRGVARGVLSNTPQVSLDTDIIRIYVYLVGL
jgi:hypothetical protein